MAHSRLDMAGATPVPPVAEVRGRFIPGPRGWLGLVLAASLLACTRPANGGSAADSVLDDADRVVPAGAPAERIVSMLPAVTELVVALGAADRLVARTEYDADPRLARLPSLGPTLSPTAEALLPLTPDLVIVGGDDWTGSHAHIERIGLRVYVADLQKTADIVSTTRRIGTLLGLESSADSLVRRIESDLAAIGRSVAGRARPTVLFLIWPDPPLTAGAGTFIDEVIGLAGGRNAFADLAMRWSEVSLEEIVRRDPEVVVVSSDGAAAARGLDVAAGWRELEAVRRGRIVTVDADLFHRPGPRVAAAARQLARALHPDAWSR